MVRVERSFSWSYTGNDGKGPDFVFLLLSVPHEGKHFQDGNFCSIAAKEGGLREERRRRGEGRRGEERRQRCVSNTSTFSNAHVKTHTLTHTYET